MNYYIQGDAAKADQIKAAFESKGFVPRIAPMYYGSESVLFFTGIDGYIYETSSPWVMEIIKTHPDYQELQLPIEPCFKVGDKIEATIYGIKRRVTIREVDKTNRCYFGTLEECIGFSEQDQWHLAPKPHYDISNFKPFDKVLVRDDDDGKWVAAFYSHYMYEEKDYPYQFATIGTDIYGQCIPFEGNEHLFRTTDMPDEYYINW